MAELGTKDLDFLAQKMGLPPERAILLTEEPHDLNNVIKVISVKRAPKASELSETSPKMRAKILLFSELNQIDFDIEEMIWVFEVIIDNYMTVKKSPKIIPARRDEKFAGYCFTLLAFKKLTITQYTNYRKALEDTLKDLGKNELCAHLDIWFKVLGEVSSKELNKILK